MVRLYSDASYHKDDGPDVAKIGRPVFNLAFSTGVLDLLNDFLHIFGLSNVFLIASISFNVETPIFFNTHIHAVPDTDSDSVRSADHDSTLGIGVDALS